MSLGKINAPEEIIKKIKERIAEILKILEVEKDLRKALAQISTLRLAFRSLAELYETKENTFASWLVWMFNSELYSDYGGKKDEWYAVNNENVVNVIKIYKSYLESIREAIEGKNIEELADATATAVSEIHKLASSRVETGE